CVRPGCLFAGALVARDDLRTAMSDDRSRHALFRAPTKLHANGRVANQRVASLSHERACQGGAVANVNLHAFQRCDAIMDEEEIRPVKDVCRPALMRYPTAGAKIECSTAKASNVTPQILVGTRSLINRRSSIWQFFNVCQVFCGACIGQGEPFCSPQA